LQQEEYGMANLVFENLVTISNEFKSFIQGGAYETLIFELLNQSKKLFPHRFEKIERQHCGECDFVDMETGEKSDSFTVSPFGCRVLKKYKED
jgi:hypothetical protein